MDLESDLHVFAEELTKTIDEFDGQIPEFELDPKSAVLKSETFVFKLRRIISKVFSGEKDPKPKSKENSSISNAEAGENGKLEKEGEQVEDETNNRRKSHRLKTPSVKNPQKKLLKFGRIISEERAKEIEKADQHLISAKIETSGGVYTLHKCVLCKQDFNLKTNARLHVFRTHLKMGSRCQTCYNVYFNQESLRHHMSKCSWAERKIVNVKSSCGEKTVTVKVSSQSKPIKSHESGCAFFPDSNKTKKSFDCENSKVKVNARNPLDSAKIKKNRLKLKKREKTAESPSNPKENQEDAEQKPKAMEKAKKRTKIAPSLNQTEKQSKLKSRIFDVEGATLICGIERSFLV